MSINSVIRDAGNAVWSFGAKVAAEAKRIFGKLNPAGLTTAYKVAGVAATILATALAAIVITRRWSSQASTAPRREASGEQGLSGVSSSAAAVAKAAVTAGVVAPASSNDSSKVAPKTEAAPAAEANTATAEEATAEEATAEEATAEEATAEEATAEKATAEEAAAEEATAEEATAEEATAEKATAEEATAEKATAEEATAEEATAEKATAEEAAEAEKQRKVEARKERRAAKRAEFKARLEARKAAAVAAAQKIDEGLRLFREDEAKNEMAPSIASFLDNPEKMARLEAELRVCTATKQVKLVKYQSSPESTQYSATMEVQTSAGKLVFLESYEKGGRYPLQTVTLHSLRFTKDGEEIDFTRQDVEERLGEQHAAALDGVTTMYHRGRFPNGRPELRHNPVSVS